MIELELWLYGKPSWDMPIEGSSEIQPSWLKKKASLLYKHLNEVADILEILLKNGWIVYGTLYTLNLYKDGTTTEKQAASELKRLGISTRCVTIVDYEND